MTIADTNDTATQREKTRSRDFPKQGSCFSKGDKIAKKVTDGYKAVENAVTSGYKKVENAVTGGFEKVEDKFVDKFLRHEGETTEEAKARLEREQAERKAKQEAEAKERAEKIAKMTGVKPVAGAKTTAEIQAEIKAKHNL